MGYEKEESMVESPLCLSRYPKAVPGKWLSICFENLQECSPHDFQEADFVNEDMLYY